MGQTHIRCERRLAHTQASRSIHTWIVSRGRLRRFIFIVHATDMGGALSCSRCGRARNGRVLAEATPLEHEAGWDWPR